MGATTPCQAASSSAGRRMLSAGVAVLAALLLIAGSARVATDRSLSTLAATSESFDATIASSNEYGNQQAGVNYPWLAEKVVVEPFKFTTLSVNYDKEQFGTKLTFVWKITPPGSTDTTTLYGSQVSTTFTELGAHALTLKAYAEDGTHIGGKTTTAHSVYVKREVRSLTEEDRENFLDALWTMWSTGTIKGRELYGSDYTGMDRFVSVHADQATGDIKCDHWHEGSGFLTHHLALSLSLEISLRAVDKRVTTPYWDFTIEGEEIYKAGWGPKSLVHVSQMFTDTWFGSMDEYSHIQDSRWAHAAAQVNTQKNGVRNSYNLIRAPWNNLPDQELVRHMSDVCGLEPVNKPVPTCKTHFTVMNMTSLSSFLLNIAGYGHGTMHVNLGGVFGACTGGMQKLYANNQEFMDEVHTQSTLAAAIEAATGQAQTWHSDVEFTTRMMVERYIHLEYFHIYRTLWRSQTCALDGQAAALQCPESCDASTPQDECVCTCAGSDDPDTFDWKNIEPCMYASSTPELIFTNLATEEFRKELVTTFCTTGVKEGEMLESASPADPLFWMIHPVLDRMLTAKRLAATTKDGLPFGTGYGKYRGFTDDTWLDYSYYSSDSYTCSGHGLDDAVLVNLPLPQHMVDGADANGDGELSNIEFWDAVDPTNGDLATYIYDDFNWDHCDASDAQGLGVEPGAQAPQDSAGEATLEFSGGVNPTLWGFADYKSLKPRTVRPSRSISKALASRKAGAEPPAPSLAAKPKPVGGAEQYEKLMSLLEENQARAEAKDTKKALKKLHKAGFGF